MEEINCDQDGIEADKSQTQILAIYRLTCI